MQANCETVFHPRSGQRGTKLMCKKSPEQCKAKVKCKCCKEKLAIEQETGKLSLNEVDSQFEQQHFVIEIEGE